VSCTAHKVLVTARIRHPSPDELHRERMNRVAALGLVKCHMLNAREAHLAGIFEPIGAASVNSPSRHSVDVFQEGRTFKTAQPKA
jgi:hypothetical protein